MKIEIEEIDNLFKSYNYKISHKSGNKVRVYTLRYGMYHAVEILLLDKNFDISDIKVEYSELGYAIEVRTLESLEKIESYLFEGFFIKTPLGNELKNRYKQFVKKQLQNLPEGSKYEYIQGSFNLLYQDEKGIVVEHKHYNGVSDTPLIKKINGFLTRSKGAVFIIIEAAAGFGKTCAANEVLNTFSTQDSKKLPFFTELSRNREARVFKHILLNEIDQQFPTGIKQNIVIEQIRKGRIPLIIDGFDELISKERNKEEVESMLTTIIELLKGDAKIIITTRKTAIFKTEKFFNTLAEANNNFSLARFEIYEPTVENWLDNKKLDLIKTTQFPIKQLSNPVLLSYLKNIPSEKLLNLLTNSDENLIDKYIDYLLKRELTRQNIKLTTDEQLKIFRKLIRFMSEYNITAESKELIKELIKEYNQKLLLKSLKEYLPEEKPSLEDLVETLSNHVFLDRKPNGDIGFVNDFIFGLLVGDNLIYGKYQKYYSNFAKIIPQDFACKAVQSFFVQSGEKKLKLWGIFNEFPFKYDVKFYFDLDFNVKKRFLRDYKNLYLSNISFDDISFNEDAKFIDSNFSTITFNNCNFNLDIFFNCNFINCNFYDCSFTLESNKEFTDFGLFTCNDNNGFIEEILNNLNNTQAELQSDTLSRLSEIMILRTLFGINKVKPRPRKLSSIKKEFSEFPIREVNKKLTHLKSKGYIFIEGEMGFISKRGITFFNKHKSEL